jgi:tetratricopeptide (TPR) repeat protein
MPSRMKHMAQLLKEAHKLNLPPFHSQRFGSILDALVHYLKRSDSNPKVVGRMFEGLRHVLTREAGAEQARSVLRAIDAFEQDQAQHPMTTQLDLTAPGRLDALMQEGYMLSVLQDIAPACDRWLKAWELVKEMVTPDMQTVGDVDRAYPDLTQSVFNWSYDLEMELHNAGMGDPIYHEHRLRYVREFMDVFPGMQEDTDRLLNFTRAQGEALWWLGRHEEAETVYAGLVNALPDEAWGYIGWADHYWLDRDSPGDYARAEVIMKRALARPGLNDRDDALDRLVDLYHKWDKPENAEETAAQLEQLRSQDKRSWFPSRSKKPSRPEELPGRNAPCWCGSGKKYKHCHWKEDQLSRA